ncbi:MAG: Rrf2 family transcriptional regulator [Clostridiales bacterium]|jgi:Rrf2 family protein|nr:Rrf2 family transcriptional regulator [Clostridiales bacterium]
MKLSTKSRYGLNACYYLAAEYDEGVNGVPLKRLSSLTGISESYLEQIISLLKKSGIIAANRGAQGGYYLSKQPSEIVVGDIVRALEDNLEIVGCINTGCVSGLNCKTKGVWEKVYNAINQTLNGIKLSDL